MREPVVLVVDDSPTVRKMVQLTLQRENMRVIAASDGLGALAAVADEDPDLILLNILLPRMDGYRICRIIRDKMEFRHVPIILVGEEDRFYDKDRGRFAGSSDYLTKPFDSVELVQAVKKHLGNAAG
ncbi:MAG TPA: response regulator [Ktedonobacterales bacterium]|nr:response regulator [Ktedonobacterales bacterium]